MCAAEDNSGVEGTWDLVRFEVYSPGNADATLREERLVITGDTLVSVRSRQEPNEPDEVIGSTYTIEGTNLVTTIECPGTGFIMVPFSVDAVELWLFDPVEPNIKVYVRA